MLFTGTTEQMQYARPRGASLSNQQKGDKSKKRKLSPVQQGRPSDGIEPWVLGGPNTDFLKHYGLDEASHPMDWLTAFMPLTPDMNQEDLAKANVKGDGVSTFAVSNWMQYSNLKPQMVGAGKNGQVIDSSRRCSHSQSSQCMGTTRLRQRLGRDINSSTVHFNTFLGSKIH